MAQSARCDPAVSGTVTGASRADSRLGIKDFTAVFALRRAEGQWGGIKREVLAAAPPGWFIQA